MICSSDIDTGLGPVDASTDVFTLAQAQPNNWWTKKNESPEEKSDRELREKKAAERLPAFKRFAELVDEQKRYYEKIGWTPIKKEKMAAIIETKMLNEAVFPPHYIAHAFASYRTNGDMFM